MNYKFVGVVAALIIFSPFASAQFERIHICGAGLVNRPDIDATPILQECMTNEARVIELLPGRYYLDSTLNLGARSTLTLRTQGVTSGPACLSKEAKSCAVLVASTRNPGVPIVKSEGAKHLALRYIALDGNIGPRRAKFGDTNWGDGTGYNATIHHCDHCQFIGFASVRAARGTGLEFEGDDAIFDRVLFMDNGWDIQSSPSEKILRYADGLTVWSSKNIQITNSTFIDNTDIDLILGNAPNARIENNRFGNTHSYAFAALMLDNFNDGWPGDFTGAVIKANQVDCTKGMCGIGINVGPHMWYPSKPILGGDISNNQINGARQGILTNGAMGTQIHDNKIEGPFPYVQGHCSGLPIAFSKTDKVDFRANSHAPKASQLEKCLPQNLATALYSPKGTDLRISRIYREVLNRNPDKAGGQFYKRALNTGWNLQDIRGFIATSDESKANLTQMSRKWLKRTMDTESEKLWIAYLAKDGSIAKLQTSMQLSE